MSTFTQGDLTLENYWRSVILFGQNVASYKFALGQALLELASYEQVFIPLEELAEPFSRHLVEHLRRGKKQLTSPSSRFIDACKQHIEGSLSKDQLIDMTVRLGFNNVIDAFHVVNRDPIPVRFYTDERKSARKGITVCDELFKLKDGFQSRNLPHETEARWRLVETAWDLNISRSLIVVSYDPEGESFFTKDRLRNRVSITSCRTALNGYQKGKCFYCFADISIIDSNCSADVDHFFPHTLKKYQFPFSVDRVWNLVLSCRDCNRGIRGKSIRVPSLRLLERLYKRNEFLIDSHHPLRETLIGQTGEAEPARKSFLQKAYNEARKLLIHEWQPAFEHSAAF